MKPRNRLFLFALIIFLLFGTVQTVFALEPAAEDFTSAFLATCADPPISHPGEITSSSQVDYYAVDLTADQFFTIDVDAEKIGSPLDSILHVFDAAGKLIAVSDESLIVPAADPASSADGKNISPDPYLEMTVDVDGTYYLAISAETPGLGADTGSYFLLLKCSDQPPTQEFKWPGPDAVGDLIGSTGFDTGSLININPENAQTSLPFDLGVGPIADIEYQYSTDTLLVAINQNPGNIITFDPATGDQGKTYSLLPSTGTVVPTVVALEAVEGELYGIQVDDTSGKEQFSLVLVTVDDIALTATLTPVFPFYTQHVRALAYNQSEKILYGVSGTALLKIDLASAPIGIEEIQLTSLLFEISSMDFSHEDMLYVVDIVGNLFKVDLTLAQAEFMGLIDVSDEVSGLTFVVGAPPDVDPIKTICSSTLTSSASASSASAAPKLSRFKLKKNPLHRAVGLFKFKGKAGETITLNAKAEDEESVEAVVEESSVSEMENPWLNYWRGKGRVFLGIRDSIPDVDFRVRKKDQLPLTMSATLPADGTYYVMLIRPLLRFYKTDYCLTLESDMDDSQAWESFDVAWPHDESDDDYASTSTAEPEDVQKSTETVASPSADDGPVPVALSTTAIAPTSASPEEPVVETLPLEAEPVADGGDPEVGQTLAETPVVEPVAETPVVEPVAETPVVEPVAETPVVEPVAETLVVEPVAVTPVVEPVAETPVVEPVAETPVVEPVAETPVVEPAAETPVVEPVAETPAVEPAADGGDDTEVVQTAADGTAVDEPVDGSR